MNRAQKKCLIASTGFHLLLVVTLFVGPGFFTSPEKLEDANILTFVPLMTTEEKAAGGGNPNGGATLPPPPTRQPQPEPPKSVPPPPTPKALAPEPEVKDRKPTKDDAESVEPTSRPKPKVSLKPVVRREGNAVTQRQPKPDASSTTEQQAFSSSINRLRSGLSTATSIEPVGPGGGGVPYANFYDGVKKVYSDAWVVPDGVTDDSATVTASVTIGRSGEVLEAKVVTRSGNALVDESIAATLRRVRFAVPLPAAAKEDKRTVRIKFNVRAQRMLG
jgi:TonB family protein